MKTDDRFRGASDERRVPALRRIQEMDARLQPVGS